MSAFCFELKMKFAIGQLVKTTTTVYSWSDKNLLPVPAGILGRIIGYIEPDGDTYCEPFYSVEFLDSIDDYGNLQLIAVYLESVENDGY